VSSMSTADRWACVSVPALPLQLLLRRHPTWQGLPVAVIAEDRPQGMILQINPHARRAGIKPGLRYAAGLALAPTLCAGTVTAEELTESVSFLIEILGRFTTEVEPCSSVPGLFWLNASGISRLYGSLSHWAQAILHALQQRGFRATVVVGFSR